MRVRVMVMTIMTSGIAAVVEFVGRKTGIAGHESL